MNAMVQQTNEASKPTRAPRDVERKRTQSDTLALALTIMGSKEALSERLRVPLEYLHPLLAGTRDMPHDLFLRVVDIVLSSTTELMRKR